MIKKYFLLTIIIIASVSCIDDTDTVNKKYLFNFFIDMKEKIKEDDLRWIQKRSSDNFDVYSLEEDLINSEDSLKNFFLNEDIGEYSVTIKYIIGEDRGKYSTIVIRLSEYSPTYYYITLKLNKNKWIIESIDKLPLD